MWFPMLVSANCLNHDPLPEGQFSEGIVESIKFIPGRIYKTHVVYLESLKVISTGETQECGFFTIISGGSSSLGDDRYSISYSAGQVPAVKLVTTAFVLNLYLEGTLSKTIISSKVGSTLDEDDYLVMRRRP